MAGSNLSFKITSFSHKAKLMKMETDLIIESFKNEPSTSACTSFLDNTHQDNANSFAGIETCNILSSEPPQLEQNIEIVQNVMNNTPENTDYDSDDIDYESDNISHQDINLKRFLASWAVEEHISQSSLRSLLDGIKRYTCENCNFGILSDPRSLLKTPRSTNVNNCANGQYYHFGILEGIRSIMSSINNINHIKISVNIDGLPLSRSSQQQFWPILGSITGSKQVFVIGIYYGKQKPSDANEYLTNFVRDAKVICEQGISLNTTKLSCTIDSIICDAPAKAFILKVKGHNGYSSCTKCITEGTFINNKMCFPEKSATLRTDKDFRSKKDENYHTGESAVLEIPNFDIVRNIPLDYMHLVCLGVVRKLLYIWLFGDLKVRLQSKKVAAISLQLENILKSYMPCEFVRKPRSLSFVKLWKATEYRSLLLYTGPIAFKDYLRKDLYNNFVTLHVAIRILCCSQFQNLMDYAQELLEYFLTTFILLYGIHNVSHNIHGLIHLVQDTKKFGVLDSFSSFKYENYLQTLKRLLKKHDKPLQQIIRRYLEYEQNNMQKIEKHQITSSHFTVDRRSIHTMGPLIEGCVRNQQYKILRNCNVTIRIDAMAENCCGLRNGSIIDIKNIVYSEELGTDVIIGHEFRHTEDLYTILCPSSAIGVFIINDLSQLKMWPIESIITKYVKLPLGNKFAVFPLLHD